MENPVIAHHTPVKQTLSLLALLFGVLQLAAQKPEYRTANDLRYDYQNKIYYVQSDMKGYTGYIYSLFYYKKDTSLLQYYRNGRMEWSKTYGDNGKVSSCLVTYFSGLKNDSICMEQITYTAGSHDTASYLVQYLDRKKVKWQKQYTYYYNDANKKPLLWYIRTSRFFTKNETKSFIDQAYRMDQNYDTAGYYYTSYETGNFIEYYETGKLKVTGRMAIYEYVNTHKGALPYYPATGRVGTWTYYNYLDGTKQREEVYNENSVLGEYRTFFPNGKMQGRYNYTKLFYEMKLPSREGISIAYYDTCFVSQSVWQEDGILSSETFTTKNYDSYTSSYYANGKPVSFTAMTQQRKPMGIWKQWDDQGHITQFVNYSVEYNDTICYAALNGKITVLNLRSRTTPINWLMMPYSYYDMRTSQTYLCQQTAIHRAFYPGGQLKSEVHLEKGIRSGDYSEWDEHGAQTVKGTFKNDLLNGAWVEWYPGGKVKKAFSYRDGLRDGTCTEYYPNGNVKWENTYVAGVSGQSKAYSENGTLLNGSNYFTQFYSASCVQQQKLAVRPQALHYYLMDTAANKNLVVLPDTVFANYGLKLIAVASAVNPEFDMCQPETPLAANEEAFDVYHSRLAISVSLSTDPNIAKIKAFFGRHGISFDGMKRAETPVIGIEQENFIWFSSKQILNKQLIIDSLDMMLVSQSGDGRKGYILLADSNAPDAPEIGGGKNSAMISHQGYTTVTIEKQQYDSNYGYGVSSFTYIVYDDMTCDLQLVTSPPNQLKYWPLNQ